MSRRDDRGFWTCHATVAAVGSTGLAAMLRHINHLSHKSDTQRDDGRSAQTTYGELAKALCCSTKTIQRHVRMGRDLKVLTSKRVQYGHVFTIEYDVLAGLIGHRGLSIPKWMLTPGPRRSRAGTQLSLDVEAEIADATQRAEKPQATAPPADEEDGVEPLTIEAIQDEIKRESGIDLQYEWAMAVEEDLIRRRQSPQHERRPRSQRAYAVAIVKRWIGEGKNVTVRPLAHDLPPPLRRDGAANRTVGEAAAEAGVPVEKYLATKRRGLY